MSRIFRLVLLCAVVLTMLGSQVGCGLIGRTLHLAGGVANMAVKLAPLKLMFMCIPEGTPIDTPTGARPIESIRPGDDVIGFDGERVRVLQVHGYIEDPDSNRFLQIQFENGAEVRLCDRHRIDGIPAGELVLGERVGGQIVKEIESFGDVERSYDLLTEDEGYRIGGLPVNSMIEEMLATAAFGASAPTGLRSGECR